MGQGLNFLFNDQNSSPHPKDSVKEVQIQSRTTRQEYAMECIIF